MKLAFLFALALSVLIAATTTGEPVEDSVTTAQRRDIHALAQYRMFSYAARLYVKANPSFVGTLTWATIGPAASTPPSMRSASMPASFQAVVESPSSFVICGELSESAATALGQLMPSNVKPYAAAGNKIVMTSDQTSANTEASKCT